MWLFWSLCWASEPESLSQLVEEVWSRHPQVAAANVHVQQQELSPQSTIKWKEPNLSLSIAPMGAGYSIRVQQPFLYRQEFSLEQKKRETYINKSKLSQQQIKEELQYSFLLHLADWMYAKRKLELSQQHYNIIAKHKNSVLGRVEVGSLPKVVLAQLESELADLSLLRIGYQTDLNKHQIRIEEFLGRPVSSDLSLDIPPAVSPDNQKPSYLKLPSLEKKVYSIQSDMIRIKKRPPLFFSMGHSNMMMDPNKWWTLGVGMLHKEGGLKDIAS